MGEPATRSTDKVKTEGFGMRTLCLMTCFLAVSGVQAALLFSEDFEAASDGDLVTLLPAWSSTYGDPPQVTDDTLIGPAGNLALDGSTAGSSQHFVAASVPGPDGSAHTYTVSADLVASETGTHNSFLAFTNGTLDRVSLNHRFGAGWELFIRDAGTVSISGAGVNTDEAVAGSIVFNMGTMTATATVSGSDGTFTSAPLSFVPSALTGSLTVAQDLRGGYTHGLDVDNILVTDYIPEPGSAVLLGLAAVALLRRRMGR